MAKIFSCWHHDSESWKARLGYCMTFEESGLSHLANDYLNRTKFCLCVLKYILVTGPLHSAKRGLVSASILDS